MAHCNCKEREESIQRAMRCGLTEDDAVKVRRIALTLHRWFELECGDGNEYGSWCITRGKKEPFIGPLPIANAVRPRVFIHDETGNPYLEKHFYGQRKDARDDVFYEKLPDRETGARKRLDGIMANYPHLRAYIQGDCRGGTIYLCKPEDATDSLYTRGVFVA